MSIREQIVTDIIQDLKAMQNPMAVLVTREPFEVDKLAITQFPAVLVSFASDTRELLTMGPGGMKNGTLVFNIRGFVRGKELDRERNELINNIERTLETNRYRDIEGVRDTLVTNIQVIERQPPLAEILITLEVQYIYRRLNP
jgi:hypothetical protein